MDKEVVWYNLLAFKYGLQSFCSVQAPSISMRSSNWWKDLFLIEEGNGNFVPCFPDAVT